MGVSTLERWGREWGRQGGRKEPKRAREQETKRARRGQAASFTVGQAYLLPGNCGVEFRQSNMAF